VRTSLSPLTMGNEQSSLLPSQGRCCLHPCANISWISDSCRAFQYLNGVCKKEGDKLFSRVCCDRTGGNDLKLKGEIYTEYKEEFFYSKSGEALAQVAQRGGRCPIPGDTQDQAGQGSEHLMEL